MSIDTTNIDFDEFSKTLGFSKQPFELPKLKVAFICLQNEDVPQNFLQDSPWGQLLCKMIFAMGLSINEAEVILLKSSELSADTSSVLNLKSKVLVLMGDHPDIQIEGKELVSTLHPSACIANSANKKNVWAQLQKAMLLYS